MNPSEIIIAGQPCAIKYQFDFGTDLDGACLRLLPNQVHAVTPGLLFEKIPGWGRWIFNATFDSFKKAVSDELSPEREGLYSQWSSAIKAEPEKSVASHLFKVLNHDRPLNKTISLPSKWENFVTIHLRVKGVNRQLPIDLTPGDSTATLAEKAYHTFYLTHWCEERGKSFSYRTFKCYKQLPPHIVWRGTTLIPDTATQNSGVFKTALTSIEQDLYSAMNDGSFQLQYNKKCKIGTAHIEGCRKILKERITAIGGFFKKPVPLEDSLVDWHVWQVLKDINLATVSAQEVVDGIAASLPLPKAHVGGFTKN